MAKEMSSNLFRMFQFGVEDRRTCRGESIPSIRQERVRERKKETRYSVATYDVIAAVRAIRDNILRERHTMLHGNVALCIMKICVRRSSRVICL